MGDDFFFFFKIIAGIKEQKASDGFSNLKYIDCRYLPKVYLSR